MTRKRSSRMVAALVVLGLAAAACGGDDDDDATPEPADEPADEPAEEPAEEPADEPADGVDLSAVCPSPLVIQTDWFPEAEHGALYQMVGEGYEIDTENLTVTGPLMASGVDTGIDIQVRTGGPAIGFNAPRVNMYTDDSIHIGYTTTDSQATAWDDLPLISVVAPLEINPQIIMWDPDVYPDVKTIADVGAAGITVNVFGGGGFSDYFVATGVWTADQVDPSYDGSPARFIAEGDIAQQGFASAEPYNYEFVFADYGKAPAYQLLHDAGFQVYSQTLGVKPDKLEELRPCLEHFVPIVQQSVVDFSASPDRANAIIIDTVTQFDSFWVYDQGLADYAVATMSALGLHGNGPDGIVGNMEESRVQKVIDDVRTAGLDVPDDLVAADMFTNEFIDPTIGLPESTGGDAAGDEGEESAMGADLSGVCPSPLVIQTDWFPEAEHGALYELIGDGYVVDSEKLTVTGPMLASGEATGIDIEVRTGGPAIGFNAPRVNMYTDDSIHIGYTTTDGQVTAWNELPLISVIAPLEINPQIIMWDPDVYPDVKTIADVGAAGITVNIFGGGGFSDVFVAQGIWTADQVDPSYDGSPARFIAEGDIAQQGFASAEPYNYEFVFAEYGKAPAYQLLHDAGYPVYSQTLGVKPDKLEELRPCLEHFVPIVQQAIVDFDASPDRANAIIIDAVTQFDSFWVYDQGLADYSVETQRELGLVGNGPDGTVGNMEADRIQTIIDAMRDAGMDVPDGLVAEDMFTNEFIDPDIGFGG